MRKGEITACKFDPSGKTLAACSADRSICKYTSKVEADDSAVEHVSAS